MRNNLPVTQNDYEFSPDATLMSVTDTKGHIIYANSAFVEVSGYDRAELRGQPHNLVRHPDMPPEAFADLWRTLKSGRAWTSLIKNRRKNGDHYWVRANACPVMRDNEVVGYLSVRTRPSLAEVESAESLYAKFRLGTQGKVDFRWGVLVRTGWMGWLSRMKTMSVRARLAGGVFSCWALAVAIISTLQLSFTQTVTLCGAQTILAVLLTIWLEKQINSPLKTVLKQAQHLAAGQPAEQFHMRRTDEIGFILRAINQAGLNLKALVDDVDEQVWGIEMASQAVARSNEHLNTRTGQTAANLEQTAASLQELASSVGNSAATANEATRLATSASLAATNGSKVMNQVASTMDTISASSNKIYDIIALIDSIAFQTNILALNAAVEAARAGPQGRGFAVVASEVRNLALRSTDAAKEIKTLIENSVAQINLGQSFVEQAANVMRDIVEQTQQVSIFIGDISHASDKQSNGIGEINTAVGELEQATQRNAAMVAESADTSDGLRNRAAHLGTAIAVFNRSSPDRPEPAAKVAPALT